MQPAPQPVVEARHAGLAALHARWRAAQDALDTALMSVGAVLMLAMMLLVVADVSLRYLFNAPLAWSYEVITSYLMPGVFFLAVSHTLEVHAHVAVDLLHQRMRQRLRLAVHAVLAVLAAPVAAAHGLEIVTVSTVTASARSSRGPRVRSRTQWVSR